MRPYRRSGRGWLIVSAMLFVSVFLGGTYLSSSIAPIIDPLQREAPTDEMIILIAYLYDREGVLSNARERLTPLGDKGTDQAVADLAARYPKAYPDRPREAQSLNRLAKDLSLSRPSSRPPPEARRDDFGWLGMVLLVGFLLLMVGSFVASVTRVRWSTLFGGLGQFIPKTGGVPGGQALGQLLRSPAQIWNGRNSDDERPTVLRRERPSPSNVTVVPAEPEAEQIPLWRMEAPTEPSADAGRLLLSFQSTYRMGQDAYQEIYPILEHQTAVLIGACGLSPGLSMEPNRPERFHTIIVWLHDYRNPHLLHNVALLSRGLYYGERPQPVETWLRSQPIRTALPAEPGRSVTLEATALRARVSILEVETDPIHNPKGAIAWLVLRFDVTLKRPTGSATPIAQPSNPPV